MKLHYTDEEVECWRDRVHRRTPRLSIRTRKQALDFVNRVGFCFAFQASHSELPCLWHAVCGRREPAMPRHSHRDPTVSFVWEMKRSLPAERLLFYGRVLKNRPTLVSLDMFTHFYALAQRTGSRDDYLRMFRAGTLSPMAKAIMDALMDSSPQVTRGLKLAVGRHGNRERNEFDRAMTELQMKMYIVKTAEHDDPFTFEWDLVPRVFPRQVRRARRVSLHDARVAILEQYFHNQLVGTVGSVSRLFRWDRQTIFQTLGTLVNHGVVTSDVTVNGSRSGAYCLIA